MSPTTQSKKRKAASAAEGDEAKAGKKTVNNTSDRSALHAAIGYEPLTLPDISAKIASLCQRVPPIPQGGFPLATKTDKNSTDNHTKPQPSSPCVFDKTAIRTWAAQLQTVLEEFHLLVACVSPATYVWGTDRSGAAEQNLGLLSNEILRSQEQILARVTPRLNDVLAPVVTLVTDKTITTKEDASGKELKQNYFCTTLEDPDYVDLCFDILARNAPLLRQVVLANLDKLLQAVDDYLQALHKDSQHDARGFVY